MMEMTTVTCFLLVIALFADVSQQQAPTCTEGWVRLGGSCYRFGTGPLTWPDATSMCRSNGGYLAEINSLEENDVVVAQIRKIHGYVNDQTTSYWIGASFKQGNWTWLSNGELLSSYTNWDSKQPDNVGGNENCLEMSAGMNYKWNDYQCSEKDLIVCESSPL